jgi:hypothetical protein
MIFDYGSKMMGRKAPWNAVDGVFFCESNTVPQSDLD